MAQDAIAAQAEIARLRFQLARYRRAEYGQSSEKLAREVEQLELAIETLEADQAERGASENASEGLPGRDPCRRVCRVQRAIRWQPRRRGRLLGPRQAQVLRCACRQRVADRQGGARTYRQALRGREGDPGL